MAQIDGPYERLGVLARQSVVVNEGLVHLELFTMQGLLTVLWHGPQDAERAVIAVGGAMGGLLGPADGLYHDLGVRFAADGIATLRVSYRAPNDFDRCVHDALAVADIAARQGATRFVTMGHSFGGAVAVQLGMAMGDYTGGVVTLATQSAGCENAEGLADIPMLLVHGDRDEILPSFASEVVHQLSGGHGELVILPGTGHLLVEAGDHLRNRLGTWIPERLAGA
ncbi:MAG: alpha/beta hydrolase [Acidimicrobiales bacterium]